MARTRSRMAVCGSVGKVTACLLLSFLAASRTVVGAWSTEWGNAEQAPLISLPPSTGVESHPSVGQEHKFYPRHIFHHGLYTHPNLHRRLDINAEDSKWTTAEMGGERVRREPLHAKSQQMTIQRLSDRRIPIVDSLMQEARLTGIASTLSPSAWTMDELYGPNVTDKDTVVNLAKMTSDSYILEPGTGDWSWLDVGIGMNYSNSFGWESDSLRGHIFADENNSTIVIALKGTSPAVFDGVETTTNDKINDNLFFGCCCGQGGQYLWRQVCDCQSSAYTCNQTCLVKALKNESRYYKASIELYGNVTELYPDSDIWLTGHSLGGSVTSLLGMTFGLPVVTFEAPGEALAATRLGLPSPPGADPSAPQTRKNTGSYHFGHTADPIFMGTCNAATSGCTLGGYAMETHCHTGNICVYDTVKDKSWRAGIVNHRIKTVVLDVLEAYDELATCELDSECVDCYNWNYFESNGTETTTSSSSISSTSSQTRTATCETPGWWGCLDEATTTSLSTSSSTLCPTSSTSSTTSSCKTPGWFGCRDKTASLMPAPAQSVTATSIVSTAPYTSPSTSHSSSTTSSCKTPGWFGCRDKTASRKPAPAPTVTATSTTSTSSSPSTAGTKCKTPGFFWGCEDRVMTPSAHAITSLASAIPTA